MKKLIGLFLVLTALLSLAACGQAAPAPTASPVPETELPASEAGTAAEEDIFEPLVFSTTDRGGNTWTESALADHKLIMINFWEPWCPPCIGEMGDLETLYQNYAEQGLLILGVYATRGMEADVDTVLEQNGTSYPILHYCPAFDVYQTGYVPATVFVNGEGRVVGEIHVGASSYAGWAAIVEELL